MALPNKYMVSSENFKGLLGPDEHIGDVLVLAKQDLQGLAVRHKDHKLGLSSLEGLFAPFLNYL